MYSEFSLICVFLLNTCTKGLLCSRYCPEFWKRFFFISVSSFIQLFASLRQLQESFSFSPKQESFNSYQYN